MFIISIGINTTVAVVAMLICAVAMMIDEHSKDIDQDIAALKASDWLGNVSVVTFVSFNLDAPRRRYDGLDSL